MPFRCRQKLSYAHYEPVCEVEDVTLENGEIIHKSVDVSERKLPDAEMFRLQNMLESGVNLEEVNSKILSSKSVNFDDVVNKLNNKQSSKGVDKNESK